MKVNKMTPTDRLNKARRKKLKANLVWLSVIVVLGLFLTLGILNGPKEKKLIYGTTVSIGQHQSKYDRNPFWVTKLNSGRLVRVYYIDSFRFVKGVKLELFEIKSKNGLTKYRLSKILNTEHKQSLQ